MYKKNILITLFVSFSLLSNAQLERIKIVFKNGDTLNGIGKVKSKTIKYKNNQQEDAVEYPFEDIKYIETNENDGTKLLFYKVRFKENYIGVEEVYLGKKIELYKQVKLGYNPGLPIGGFGNGGMRIAGSSYSEVIYYIKRPNDDTILLLGSNSPLDDLKDKVLTYLPNCQIIIDKIKNKELKVRKDLKEIVELYDTTCE
jgi:hypothetical protein